MKIIIPKNHTFVLFLIILFATTPTTLGANQHTTTIDCQADPEYCEQSESWVLVILSLFLLLAVLLNYWFTQSRFRYLPESIIIILLGIVVGLIIRTSSGKTLQELIVFDTEVFFLFLLPPIIFHSGYSLHNQIFFSNIGTILFYAVVGTIISTVIVGGLIMLTGLLSPMDSFIYGSLISAVDPVATLAIFESLHVSPTLNILVFGESVLNDAVSVVLYHTLIHFTEEEALGDWMFFSIIGKFLIIFLGSVAIGIAFGLISALILKSLKNLKDYPALELSLVVLFAYIPYIISDGLGLSGIMAILFVGITMSHYTQYNITQTSEITVHNFFKTIAYLAETSVFAFLGISVFSVDHSKTFDIALISWSIVAIILGRIMNIFPLTGIINNLPYRAEHIPFTFQIIMCFSGLRGAIAFALAMSAPGTEGPKIMTTTLFVVIFTIVVFGGGTLPLLKCLKIEIDPHELIFSKTQATEVSESTEDHDIQSTDNLSYFERLDLHYLRPAFRSRNILPSEVGDLHAHTRVVDLELESMPSGDNIDIDSDRGSRRSHGPRRSRDSGDPRDPHHEIENEISISNNIVSPETPRISFNLPDELGDDPFSFIG